MIRKGLLFFVLYGHILFLVKNGLEAKSSLVLRVYMLSVASGDLSDSHFESFKDAFYAFFRIAKS